MHSQCVSFLLCGSHLGQRHKEVLLGVQPIRLACLFPCLQDGTIQCEMKLTGILSTSLTSMGDRAAEHGIVVAPGG